MSLKRWVRLYQRVTSLLLFSRAMEALMMYEENTLTSDSAEDREYWHRQEYSKDVSFQLLHHH